MYAHFTQNQKSLISLPPNLESFQCNPFVSAKAVAQFFESIAKCPCLRELPLIVSILWSGNWVFLTLVPEQVISGDDAVREFFKNFNLISAVVKSLEVKNISLPYISYFTDCSAHLSISCAIYPKICYWRSLHSLLVILVSYTLLLIVTYHLLVCLPFLLIGIKLNSFSFLRRAMPKKKPFWWYLKLLRLIWCWKASIWVWVNFQRIFQEKWERILLPITLSLISACSKQVQRNLVTTSLI